VNYRSDDATVQSGRVYVYRLRTVDADGSYGYSREVEVDMRHAAEGMELSYLGPNPAGAGDEVEVGYVLPEGQTVSVELYSADGRRVLELVNGYRAAGEYTATIRANDLPSGQYMLVIKTAGNQLSR